MQWMRKEMEEKLSQANKRKVKLTEREEGGDALYFNPPWYIKWRKKRTRKRLVLIWFSAPTSTLTPFTRLSVYKAVSPVVALSSEGQFDWRKGRVDLEVLFPPLIHEWINVFLFLKCSFLLWISCVFSWQRDENKYKASLKLKRDWKNQRRKVLLELDAWISWWCIVSCLSLSLLKRWWSLILPFISLFLFRFSFWFSWCEFCHSLGNVSPFLLWTRVLLLHLPLEVQKTEMNVCSPPTILASKCSERGWFNISSPTKLGRECFCEFVWIGRDL